MASVSPKLHGFLEEVDKITAEQVKQGFKMTPTNIREGIANIVQTLVTDIPEVALIQDDLVLAPEYDAPVRIYHPAPTEDLPVAIFYHGGGHMVGSVTVYDAIARKLAQAARHVVVSTEYRLAPECPYPAGLHDCYNVVKGVWRVLDGRGLRYRRELSIVGDSGGGALCASVSRLAQFDPGVDILRQVLIYPSVDYTMNSPSMTSCGEGYWITTPLLVWFFDNYLRHSENRYEVSPLYGEFTDKLPETLVVTVQFDPLRDEGIAYFEKVQAAGVHAELLHLDDMIHAYLDLEDLVKEECQATYHRIAEFLNRPAA